MALNGSKYKVINCVKNNPGNKYYSEEEDGNKLEIETTEA